MVFAFLGTQEIIIVLVVALLVFGPQKLPEIGKQVGSALREMNRMRNDFQRALDFDEITRDNQYPSYHSGGNTYSNGNGYDHHYDYNGDHYAAPDDAVHAPLALESAESAVATAESDHNIGETVEATRMAPVHTVAANADYRFVAPPGPPAAQVAVNTATTTNTTANTDVPAVSNAGVSPGV